MSDPPPEQRAARGNGNNAAAEQIKRVADTLDSYARQREAAEAKKSKHDREIRRRARRATIGTWVYTGITALIFVAGIRSIQEARRATHAAGRAADAATAQAKISEDTEKRQLRAYVFFVSGSMHDFIVPRRPYVSLRIKNSGQTPAYDATMDLAISLKDLTDPGNFNDPGHPSPPTPIGPGVDLHPILTADASLIDAIVTGIRSKRIAYFAYGTIRYKDAFRKDHWTKVRLIFGADELSDGTGTLSLYREGNDADQDP